MHLSSAFLIETLPSPSDEVMDLLNEEKPLPRAAADICLHPEHPLTRAEVLAVVPALLRQNRQANYGRISGLLNRAATLGLLNQDESLGFRRQANGNTHVAEPEAIFRGGTVRVRVDRGQRRHVPLEVF